MEERNTQQDRNTYLFSGKELDEETGLSYYGARYFDPQLGRWHGVDPLTEKYFSMSPYNYVANNPLKFIDPNGEIIIIFGQNGQQYVYGSGDVPKDKFIEASVLYLDRLKKICDAPNIRALDEKERNIINVMMDSKYEVRIKMFDENNEESISKMDNVLHAGNAVDPFYQDGQLVIGSSSTIYYDSKDKIEDVGLDENGTGAFAPPIIALGHELWHSYQGVLGILWHQSNKHPDFKLPVPEVSSTHFENILRAIFHIPLRKWYNESQKNANALPLIDDNGVRSESTNSIFGNTEKYDYKKEHVDTKID